MAKIALLVGTRPNIGKITQFKSEFKKFPNHKIVIINNNQPYSESVSSAFFSQFDVKATERIVSLINSLV
jgi:UDP-N-acetylglucosamine 2-epimerase